MAKIVSTLSESLVHDLKTADEIWVAVALINVDGLNYIQSNLKKGCKQNYLIGIDLPTHPDALLKLYNQYIKNEVQIKIYSEKEYFHPKVYLVRKSNTLKGFIGSGNCTNGGLNANIELTSMIDDKSSCANIQDWFEKLNKIGKPLTLPFLNKYKDDYIARLNRKKEDDKLAREGKRRLNEEIEAIFAERQEFIKVLKSYRKKAQYNEIVEERKQSVKTIRKSLDYPSFKNPDIDLFFTFYSLGHLIAISKPKIIREKEKFKELLVMLCDEKLSINQRYNLALKGEYKVKGAGIAFVSKVLTIHKPELYYVENDRTLNALKKFGIEFPRGLTIGDKYEITCNVLKEICLETGMENLTVLDYYLYMEGEGKIVTVA